MEGTEQTVKPQWKDAPEWANWLVQEEDGYWWWHESRPTHFLGEWVSPLRNEIIIKSEPVDDSWKQSLEQRPKQ